MLDNYHSNHNCLIVDDDPIFVAMLEQTLRNRGLGKVYSVSDGVQAIEFLANNQEEIQALTLDLNMPNVDGIGFLTHVAKVGFCGEIFLSSGEHKNVLDSALQLARMLGLNCQQIFTKPVNFDDLADSVMQVNTGRLNRAKKKIDKAAIDVALGELRIEAHYQPRINLKNLTIAGAEVLARIQDDNGNFLDTQKVIRHAEHTGRVADLTWKMLENLVVGIRHFDAMNVRPPLFSININGLLMASSGFSVDLVKFFKKAKIDPKRIILEITETGLPPDPAAALEAFARIRMNSFGIALDDFGTGYSNIENLKMFPFTELKIDKGFVSHAQNNAFSRECIATSVRLAKELDLQVVAEGIENEYELNLAKRYDIDQVQGFLFSRALPLKDFFDLYQAGVLPLISNTSVQNGKNEQTANS